jgi:cell division protein ZapB
MISEFHNLSDKIDRLAELTLSLRRENAALRQANALLSAENADCKQRLAGAHQRVEALLAALPESDAPAPASPDLDDELEDDLDLGVDAHAPTHNETAR